MGIWAGRLGHWMDGKLRLYGRPITAGACDSRAIGSARRRPVDAWATWLIAIALLTSSSAWALDPSTALTQYGHTAWRIREGHFAGPPSAVTQTRDGFLWIGTQTGLIRFDGVRFVPWQPPAGSHLPNERIVSLLGARDGSLWIGTANGLAQWRAPNLVVHARVGRFGALLEDRRGTIWAGHTRAVSELPPLCRSVRGDFRCFRFADEYGLSYVRALHEDRQGDVWLGGDRGVCRWKPETPENPECYTIASPAQVTEEYGVFVLGDDSGGTLWAGTKAQGIWWLVAGRWMRYPSPPDPELEAQEMLSDREGGLWLGTLSHGLIRIAQRRTERFTRADGLSGDAVNDVFEDREGSLWVATTAGLDRFRDVKVATLTAQEGLGGGDVGAVVASRDGSLWIAERRALIHLNPTGMSFYRGGQDLPGSSPTSLFEDSRGRLWVGVDVGLAWWEHGRFFQLKMPDGSAVGMVRAMAQDRDGNLWVATVDPSRPLVRVRDDRVIEVISADRLGGRQVRAMAADPEGGLWLGLASSELKRYRNGRIEAHGAVGDPSRRLIYNLLPDVRGLWVATNQGLGLLRNGKLSTLDTRNGLPCDTIEDVVPGGDGSLWLKAACGLVQILPGELDAWSGHPERRVRVRAALDAFDGSQSGMSPFTPRSAKSLDGRLWFAIAEGGLQVVDPGKIAGNGIPPPVQILRLVADRKRYEPQPRLRLPPLTRDLEIDYTALSFIIPERVRFRYRLEGAGDGWHDAGTRREAFFNNLRPGSYRFRVVACNNDSVWNETGAALDFTLLPAFYQTGWFLLLCTAAAGCLAWVGYQWRVRQVTARLDLQFQERLAERTRVARELHDTLLGDMAGVAMQLSAASRRAETAGTADTTLVGLLAGLGAQVQQALTEARRSVTAMRNPPREVSVLVDRLSESADRTFAGSGIAVEVERVGAPRRYPESVEAEVVHIATEAMTNARQHASCRRVELWCSYGRRQLQVRVRDDGRGFDPHGQAPSGHWGLVGMRERSAAIGARLAITSAPGAGTEVLLVVPVSAGGRRRWRWTASARSQGA
jgi:ligand-binding sensor domain-containing protein/signal transduction histidine kinase